MVSADGKFYAVKEFKISFRRGSEDAHCESLALTTHRSTTLPFAVAIAKLCVPVRANGVCS
jgi:hypothetical protein